ncbi:MAG: hypothetical protein LBJ08_03390 [Bifidobacteriaceae bacterium]|jgi:hypothetical protein|nr:hypothetical protein [Bifidobacteriaceae bacterium]
MPYRCRGASADSVGVEHIQGAESVESFAATAWAAFGDARVVYEDAKTAIVLNQGESGMDGGIVSDVELHRPRADLLGCCPSPFLVAGGVRITLYTAGPDTEDAERWD